MIQGLLYGGTSGTFANAKKPVLKKLNDERWRKTFILPHFDKRKSFRLGSNLLAHQKNEENKNFNVGCFGLGK